MEKLGKVAIFMDYNGTFDELEQGKGNAMIFALRRFATLFENTEIIVVTGARSAPEHCSIRQELAYCMTSQPFLKTLITHLVEENCRSVCDVVEEDDLIRFRNERYLAPLKKRKKDAVESFLAKFDPDEEISCCVFVGDDGEIDVDMLESDVGNREKFMIYTNRRSIKSEKPLKLCKISHSTFSFHSTSDFLNQDLADEMLERFGCDDGIVFHTDKNSYGVAMGFGALASFLIGREKFIEQAEETQNTTNSQEKKHEK